MGLFSRKEKMDEGLAKTRKGFFAGILDMMNAGEIDDSFYDDLEEQLILADTGADEAARLVEALREAVRRRHIKTADDAIAALKEIICAELEPEGALDLAGRPAVILVIGVNGVGKTTSIAKLAKLYKEQGKRVLLAAGDTFRAAAAEQLSIWAERVEVPIVKHSEGADPAAVVFDAVQSAAARGYDLVICDTAGRLHNKQNLMNELAKIRRIITRELPEADVETLMVIDATTGQNGLIQAKQFADTADITGIVLTKLDGTARGGIVFAIAREMGVPVKYVGVGEGMDDLMPFEPKSFSEALLS